MSIALKTKVASFQNTGLCFVEVPAEESTSTGVSPQHAVTAVVCKNEQNNRVIVQKKDIFSCSQGIPEPLDSLYMERANEKNRVLVVLNQLKENSF